MSYAKAILAGRVANVVVTEKRASLSLAVQSSKDSPTHWFSLVAFDPLLKTIGDHVQTGRFLLFECRPQTRTWSQGGQPRKMVEFVIEKITLLPRSTEPADRSSGEETAVETGVGHEQTDPCEPGADDL